MATWIQTRTFNRNITDLAGMCHRLVRSGYNIPAGGPRGEAIGSAWAAWLFSNTKHTDRNFPTNVAVPIWFSHIGNYDGTGNKNWGHVVVWYPGVGYISSPPNGKGQRVLSTIAQVESMFNSKYVGWTEDVNGRTVIQKQALSPDQRQVKSNSNTNVRSAPNTKASITRKLPASGIYTFDGYVIGENYGGINIWFQTGKEYVWAGSFTNSSTAGLPNLTPKPDPVITVKLETTVEELPYQTVLEETNLLPLNVTELSIEGILGSVTTVTEITFTDGVETSRKVLSTEVVDPVDEVYLVGTYVEPDPEPEPEPEPEKPTANPIVVIGLAIAGAVAWLLGLLFGGG